MVALTPRRRGLSVLLSHLAVAAGAFMHFVIPLLQTRNPTLDLVSASDRLGAGSGAVRSIARAVGLDSIAEPLARLAQGIAPFVILLATAMVVLHLLRWER